jgi:hypothetical protein
VSVREGAGPLEPGASADVRAVLSVDPERLTGGRVYTGVWVLDGHNLPVTARILALRKAAEA